MPLQVWNTGLRLGFKVDGNFSEFVLPAVQLLAALDAESPRNTEELTHAFGT